MSWNIRVAGKDKAALKARVVAEAMPEQLKVEICARIDSLPVHETQAVLVESHGHLDGARDAERPFLGLDTMVIKVYSVPFIDTPLPEVADPVKA